MKTIAETVYSLICCLLPIGLIMAGGLVALAYIDNAGFTKFITQIEKVMWKDRIDAWEKQSIELNKQNARQ